MSPAHVLEPTYRRLKDALLEGRFRAGTKLEAMRLADDFGVSMTPVRDSLNQLVGEGLVDLTPGEGFRVPLLTEQALRDILQVNALLLEQAPDNDHKSLTINEGSNDTRGAYADRLARAFRDIAASSGNRFGVSRKARPASCRENTALTRPPLAASLPVELGDCKIVEGNGVRFSVLGSRSGQGP